MSRITYVVSRWGEPSQTFVRREANAVRQLGVEVNARSLKLPGTEGGDVSVRHLGPSAVLWRSIRAGLAHPVKVAGVLGAVVRRASLRNIAPQIYAALHGIAWSTEKGLGEHLHAHFGWVAATSAWSVARMTGRSYSVVLHAFELHKPRYQDRFTPLPLHEAKTVFTISERDAEEVRHRWSIDAEVLRMGVTTEWLESQREHVRDPWLIASVGSLVPKKGHDRLLRALAKSHPNWRLTIIGVGPERVRLEALRSSLGLDDRVQFWGPASEAEVLELLDSAAVFCLACVQGADGDRDGIPVALMEAMARSTPVVSTCLGAIPELVEDAGILVPTNDVDALSAAIDRLRDQQQRDTIGPRGQERVRAMFSVDSSARRVRDLVRAA